MIEYSPFKTSNISQHEWDEFVEESDNGTIFHTRKFLSYHPQDRFQDASIVVKRKNNLFSVLPAVIIERDGKKILSSHAGASYGSFAYRSDLNFQDAHDLVDILLDHAKKLKCDRVQVTPPPIIYQSKLSNYIDFALVRNGFSYLKREVSSVVQLDTERDKLIYTYRPEARTALKKAIKQGVEIAECERFEEYYEILKKNLKMRHGVTPTHTLDELLKLKYMFPTKVRLWGAFVGDKLIAGVCNFSANSRVVLAFYISHDEDYQEYRAVNLLFYEIMKRYQDEGFKYLDFGIFTVNMDPNWGLARFKENFGSRGIFRDYFFKDLK
ncbi:MAG: GNAT family N-acetyltransferase [Ignavibacteria bacterium]|jgi:lipid II:glycine glycyltransferase (peptidoglycan interpeptide bridge formation enzyme)|nr:GNAT family N-acetyltransferase [Ignavibacteria bacterium]MCU7501795.1 GNAT family N-acetyltransferase [Ignavibacteria bacterium]MCU7518284.1 GNAT family N-acetyltransferase [Ignavibacteria bacterium]